MRGGVRNVATGCALLALVVAGCGGKSEREKLPNRGTGLQPRSMKISAAGTTKKLSLTIPDSVRAGLTRVDFTNDAKGPHALQFVRVDGSHSDSDALKTAIAWADKGKPLPGWLHPSGGTPVTGSGATGSAVQLLPPGHYIVVDTEGAGPPSKPAATFEATGTSEGVLQGAPARIETYEYGFKATGLTVGARILIDNKGSQPHFVEAAPLKKGATLEDLRKALKSRKGPPPIIEKGAVRTPVLDGHTRELIDLKLHKGRYALLCFVPDRQGGPPHALKGMVGVTTVR